MRRPLAHDKIRIPEKFRGGMTAVKKEAVRLLPDIVRSFDPTGKKYMDNHITDVLEGRLNAFVAEHARHQY